VKNVHKTVHYAWVFGLMVFNATFNNISVILVEETGGPGENHQPFGGY
jgi:hypothetical protein